MRNNSSPTRIQYIDAAKGIGMLAIIAGHLGCQIVERFVFTFHVPIFFFICGYLYKYKRPMDRVIHLIRPYIYTAMILMVLTNIREILKMISHRSDTVSIIENTWDYIKATLFGSGVRTDFLNFSLKPIGAIWFLLALLISLILFDFLLKRFLKKPIILYTAIIVMAITGYLSSKYIWLPLSVQPATVGILFLAFGYLLRKSSINVNYPFMTLGALFVWGISIYISYREGNMSMAECLFPSPVMNILGSASASYAILSILHSIENNIKDKGNIIWTWLCSIGRESTAVLCVHLIEIRTVPWHFIRCSNEFLYYLIVYVIKIIIATITVYLVKMYKFKNSCV